MSPAPGSGAAHTQRGSGTVLMLAVVCVAALGLLVVLMFTAVAQAGAKAGTAADLAALAAADAARLLFPGDPCVVAAATSVANDATLAGCSRQGPGGEIVMVRVEVPVAPVGWLPTLARAHSVAKAGPPPQPWLRE
ncbi:Rv3654c family TadE-like protein [Paeniglutamicibacter antarcticus]|uniref:Secretion/DNA translocation related TadE-like protein n=1 Tax=Paeniglutamicibacter antarcticus TaxID=494023 RepID=A0ABP9TQN0_9MICC